MAIAFVRLRQSMLEAAWGVVSPLLPGLRREVALILDPSAADEVEESPAPQQREAVDAAADAIPAAD